MTNSATVTRHVLEYPRISASTCFGSHQVALDAARPELCVAVRSDGSVLVLPPSLPPEGQKGTEFDLSRQASSSEISAMIISGLAHVGFNTAHFSGISARRGGVSTAIEAGVPESVSWMQSGHAQDVEARSYVSLNSPALLYRTYESFGL